MESDTSFVEVSLPAGKYRYRVYAFDFLGRQASVSDWRDFTVLKAVQPQIVNKEKTVVPVKDDKKVSIPVDVKSIEEDSKVELVNKETNQVVEGKLDVKVDDKNQLVASEAVFPMVEEGNWVVKVTNPSGLFTESEEIKLSKGEYSLLVYSAANNDEWVDLCNTFQLESTKIDFIFSDSEKYSVDGGFQVLRK